jgi:hypothetical protein
MEIRISLDRVEPPAGSLRLVSSAEPPGPAGGQDLLRDGRDFFDLFDLHLYGERSGSRPTWRRPAG